MRKKPPGQLLASAHQVDREYRVMKALGTTGFPVPVMRALCQDDGVIGTAFYVMDYMEGRIFRDARLPGVEPAERAAIYDELNAVLARLHGVDYAAIGLADYGRPGNYFARQIDRWTKQYRGAETERVEAMERLIAELPARIPTDDTTAIAHGDYRLENVMFHPTEPRLIAVLDWELSTLGHPLADVGYNCLLWHSVSEGWGSLDRRRFRNVGHPDPGRVRRRLLPAHRPRADRRPELPDRLRRFPPGVDRPRRLQAQPRRHRHRQRQPRQHRHPRPGRTGAEADRVLEILDSTAEFAETSRGRGERLCDLRPSPRSLR